MIGSTKTLVDQWSMVTRITGIRSESGLLSGWRVTTIVRGITRCDYESIVLFGHSRWKPLSNNSMSIERDCRVKSIMDDHCYGEPCANRASWHGVFVCCVCDILLERYCSLFGTVPWIYCSQYCRCPVVGLYEPPQKSASVVNIMNAISMKYWHIDNIVYNAGAYELETC